MGIADHWNTSAEDFEGVWACDGRSSASAVALYRAIDVDAPLAIVWRWVCQLRVAPYSYDWIDNFGRKSPTVLTSGLDQIEIGQTVMSMFRVVDFAAEDQLTLAVSGFLGLGPLHVTYRLRAQGGPTRLAVKLAVERRPSLFAGLLVRGLAIGDWIMMRKQLLTLKAHAEASASQHTTD